MPRNNIRLRLKEPILDEHIDAAVNMVDGPHPETGHYGTLHYVECPTRERATEIKQALHRAAQRKKFSVFTEIIPEKDKTFTVKYTVATKAAGQAYVVAKYGNDRSKWPYDPKAPRKKD